MSPSYLASEKDWLVRAPMGSYHCTEGLASSRCDPSYDSRQTRPCIKGGNSRYTFVGSWLAGLSLPGSGLPGYLITERSGARRSLGSRDLKRRFTAIPQGYFSCGCPVNRSPAGGIRASSEADITGQFGTSTVRNVHTRHVGEVRGGPQQARGQYVAGHGSPRRMRDMRFGRRSWH